MIRISVAVLAASGLVFAGTGTAAADPEPPTSPPVKSDAFLDHESSLAAAQEQALSSGAIGVGYDPTGRSVVAVFPSDAKVPGLARGIATRRAAVDTATMRRFETTLKSRAWSKGAAAPGYGYYVDTASGLIVVETDAPAAVTGALARAFPGQLDLRVGSGASRLSRQNDGTPHWGGASITNGSSVCTSGFSVKNSAGTRYMVTAGHCFGAGAAVRSTGGGGSFGTVVNRASFPTWDLELLGGGSYGTYIYTGNSTGTGTHVVSASDPAVGSTYCVSGQTTATTCNHTASSLTGQFCDASGCTPGLIVANGGASIGPGDSGAPFFYSSGGNAYIRGVTIAKSGGSMYAEKWSTVANHFGVSIVS